MAVDLAKYNSQCCRLIFVDSEETHKGRMNQQRQGVGSTKPKNEQTGQLQYDYVEKNLTPATHRKQNDVYCKTWYMKETIYTDQTGKFTL